jgi:hypothetical protein
VAEFVIVGIDDPYGKTPLQPDILGSSGHKLWSMTGLSMPQYVKVFQRVNLYEHGEDQNPFVGRRRAKAMIMGANKSAGTFFVCLGSKVADAFGIKNKPKMKFFELKTNVWAAHLPHTSGLNRWYNSADNKAAATNFMRQVAAGAAGRLENDDVFHIMGEL